MRKQLTIYQRDTWTVGTSFADTVEIPFQKVRTTNLEALLDDLGCKLIHAILSGISKNMVNGTASILRRSVFTDMLDAPISKLAVGDNVNACKDFINAAALFS